MDKTRIAEFLAQGIAAADVARIVGCTPAYLSQLASDEEFVAILTAKKEEYLASSEMDTILEDSYTSLETKIVHQLSDSIATATVSELARTLEAVAKRRDSFLKNRLPALAANNGNNNVTVVNIAMPSYAIPSFQKNANNEIVAVDDKSLAPLPSSRVRELFASLKKEVIENGQDFSERTA